MAKKKRRKPPKGKKYTSKIPKTANPTRFFIFLVLALILFAIFYYFAVIESGGLSP